jgi:DNA-binding NtrC family response regulator
VRELRNVIERGCILSDSEFITERELSISMPSQTTAAVAAAPTTAAIGMPAVASGDSDLLITVEREHIQRALLRSGGNKKAAAKMLGLSRRALYRRLERLDLAGTISRRREPELMEA